MSIRVLVDCEALNYFVRRQSIDNFRLIYAKRESSLTRMTLRFAVDTFVENLNM